ncbi:MAG TPA: glycosyltransferase [Solirubrobacterales bacterium]|nr:glycosyltransferase [Solirubrobacterales bacterium]
MKSRQIAEAPAAAERRGGLRVCMVHYSDFAVDSRIQRQARALAERGDRVDCVCLNDEEEVAVGTGRIVLHRAAAEKPRGGAGAYLSGNARFLLGAARKVSALDREEPFDVIEIHNMPDALVFAAWRPKLRGTPLILNFHDTFPELFATLFDRSPGHPLVRLVRLEERVSAALADGLVFVTPEARDLLAGRGIDSPRTQVVMNTPEERVFGERRTPAAPPADGELRVVYHGGLAERFGVETLVRAVALLRASGTPVRLDVFGADAEAAARLAAVAAEHAPEGVHVAPRPTPVEQIPARLEEAHIGVVPTLHDDFTEMLLPVKLLEYVHMGMPVVASRLPVIERYFGDDVLLAEPGDAASFAAAIEGIRRAPESALERARGASQRLAEIEWRRQRQEYLALVDGLVAHSRIV